MNNSGNRGVAGGSVGNQMAGYDVVKHQNFTPDQMNLFKQLFQHVQPGSFLNQLASGDESQFAAMEQPGYRLLNENLGGLASRFSFGGGAPGFGGGGVLGGRHGSGFQNAASSTVRDFTENMLARRQDLQRQSILDLLGISNSLLGQSPEHTFFQKQAPEKRPFWQSLLGGALPAAGAAVGGYVGGVPGAQLGAQIGGSAGQAFM